MKAAAAPVGQPWLWTLAYGQHEDRTPTHGYETTREAAMAVFVRAGGGSERAKRGQSPTETGKRIMAYWIRVFHNPHSKKFFEVTSDEINLPRLRARISELKSDP